MAWEFQNDGEAPKRNRVRKPIVWSNGVCERMVGMTKEESKRERGCIRTNGDDMEGSGKKLSEHGFSGNQLVLGKNPTLPNLI